MSNFWREYLPIRNGESTVLEDAQRMMERRKLLNRLKLLTVEERAKFEKWYGENQQTFAPADWPGFKMHS